VASTSKPKGKDKGKGKAKAKATLRAEMLEDEIDDRQLYAVLLEEKLRHVAQVKHSLDRVAELEEKMEAIGPF
jgi:hypothetical protein